MVSLDPIVARIFKEAADLGASDIHLEPEEHGLRLRYRVGGLMREGPLLDTALQEALVAKLKLLARLDSTQLLAPQDGAFVIGGTQVRLSVIPALGGESVVMRLFRRVGELERLEGLGLLPAQIADIKKAIAPMHGLLIIAGPTGSGKTTTFYATLRAIDPAAQKIITVEDPVEQRLEGVCQTPVGPQSPSAAPARRENGPMERLTFSTALRSILRQAPNVIGVGELRDLESARMALQAALTGHLVVATLHADSAAGVPARLTDMGLEPTILAEVLCGVISQRLLQGRGACPQGAFEVLLPTAAVRQAIKARHSSAAIEVLLAQEKFFGMRQSAEAMVRAGKVNEEAVLAEFFA